MERCWRSPGRQQWMRRLLSGLAPALLWLAYDTSTTPCQQAQAGAAAAGMASAAGRPQELVGVLGRGEIGWGHCRVPAMHVSGFGLLATALVSCCALNPTFCRPRLRPLQGKVTRARFAGGSWGIPGAAAGITAQSRGRSCGQHAFSC